MKMPEGGSRVSPGVYCKVEWDPDKPGRLIAKLHYTRLGLFWMLLIYAKKEMEVAWWMWPIVVWVAAKIAMRDPNKIVPEIQKTYEDF